MSWIRTTALATAGLGTAAAGVLAAQHHRNRERWAPTEFGSYEVSSHGRVRRAGATEPLKPFNHTQGYYQVNLSQDGTVHRRYVHDLVASSHLGPRPEGHIVNHRDGDKTHNRVRNLEYATISRNAEHAYELGLQRARYGSDHPRSTLTDDLVRKIRARAKSGEPKREIAADYGISVQTIYDIQAGRTWSHLDS